MGVSSEIGSWADLAINRSFSMVISMCGDFFFSGLRPISCESSLVVFFIRDGFVEVNRQSDSAGLICDRACNCLTNPPRRVCGLITFFRGQTFQRRGSNLDFLPESSLGTIVPIHGFLAIETTKRRLDCTILSFARRPM